MTAGKWDPFGNANKLQDRINRMFEDIFPGTSENGDFSACTWKPVVDIYEAGDGIVITADLPGVEKNDVSIEVKGNVLVLKGERRVDSDAGKEKYFCKERCHGTFFRAFTLKTAVLPEKIMANFKNGVLTIRIPHPEEEKPRPISVNVD